MRLYHGDIVYAKNREELAVYEDSYLAVEDGLVEGIYPCIPEHLKNAEVEDFGRGLIVPAFHDLHIHAPQYAQRGTSMDLLLSDWLNQCTFPEEAKFADLDYARKIYSLFAEDLLRNGTFCAAVFGTLHREATEVLCEELEKRKIRAYVGKVNMDCGSPDFLTETTEQSLLDTEAFLESCGDFRFVKPILTPRFAPTCSGRLLKGLGRLAEKYACGVHTHLVESKWEAAESVRLFPECSSDANIYEQAGLLGHGPAIFAHTIFPTDDDIRVINKYHATSVHCPDATTNIIAGIMPVQMLLDRQVDIALGCDVGAGQSPAAYRQIARAVQLSKLKEFYEPEEGKTICFSTAFFLGTRCREELFGKTGAFEKGYRFDALVIDGMEDGDLQLSPEKRLERFCYIGDDRNIAAGFAGGLRVLSR